MRHGCLIAGFLVWMVIGACSSEAQFSANDQTNIISGVTSNWSGTYQICCSNNALLIQNGGVLFDDTAEFLCANEHALVTGSGSVWSNRAGLEMDNYLCSGRNSLVISNGGQVISLGWVVLGTYSASYSNSVLVSDSGSRWDSPSTSISIGDSGWGNSLVISNGGQVTDWIGYVGDGAGSNSVFVTGAGSVWSNEELYVGAGGSSNTLVISNGGSVLSTFCFLGYGGSNNGIVVTGNGSVLSLFGGLNPNTLTASNNNLVVSNGGAVMSRQGATFNRSSILVTGSGSFWSNGVHGVSGVVSLHASSLVISNGGQVVDVEADLSGSTANVMDGCVWRNGILTVLGPYTTNVSMEVRGSVFATNLVVGTYPGCIDPTILQVDNGSVVVTNGTQTAVLEVRYGQLVINGGIVQADTLVMTNPCASLVHAGGTLIVGSVIVDPNLFRITSVVQQTNDMVVTWMMGPGATNSLQATAGDGSGGYSTNGFTDIFIVTNNTTVGTVTNYLDMGAAATAPARYYRARLAP